MYYMPVNPVNSAMIMNCRGKYLRTEKLVDDFNRMIRRTLCSGKNKCYTYINSYDHFRKKDGSAIQKIIQEFMTEPIIL